MGAIFGAVRGVVQAVALGLSLYALVVWLTDVAARNGTISPYGGFARTVRRLGDPLVRRVERWLLRQGGVPSSASGWAVVFCVGGSLVALWAVDFLGGVLASVTFAAASGPRGLLFLVADLLFQALFVALLIRVLGTWFGLSPYSPFGRVVHALTDWILDPLRRFVPPLGGMIDLTPMIAYFLLQVARGALLRLIAGGL